MTNAEKVREIEEYCNQYPACKGCPFNPKCYAYNMDTYIHKAYREMREELKKKKNK